MNDPKQTNSLKLRDYLKICAKPKCETAQNWKTFKNSHTAQK